jgi:hypothetical protein
VAGEEERPGEPVEPRHPREEYLFYVRVPDPEDETEHSRNGFLERLAQLLSDDDEHIYVEPHRTADDTKKPRGTHGRESGIKDEGEDRYTNSVVGGNNNSLQPMYFCHNKY